MNKPTLTIIPTFSISHTFSVTPTFLVIPAKAGIHRPSGQYPTSASMDPRLRGDDSVKAEMTGVKAGMASVKAGMHPPSSLWAASHVS
jgi:hypothetical protein